MDDKVYPVSEIFTSPQGEGQYAGVLMTFIRLAGCTVGKPFPKERYQPRMDAIEGAHEIPGLPIYTEQCTLYDGRTFECDTDYRVKDRLTSKQIIQQLEDGIDHVCITGGEPFMHDLRPLVQAIEHFGAIAHVETSGTVHLQRAFPPEDMSVHHSSWEEDVWITVSPKFGILPEMVERANEIKLLIDKDFNPKKVPDEILKHPLVYIQPVNGEHKINSDNLKLCMELQHIYKNWRVSLQLHKALESIIRERVR